MKQEMKEGLKKLYEAPKPERKRAFLRELDAEKMHTGYLLWIQISYISNLEWILSGIFVGIVVLFGWFYQNQVFGIILVMMPFLAVAGISESMRSVIYGMDELEMSARFSLKSIVLARMWIVGIENLALAFAAALFIQGSFVQAVLYFLVPYLLTVYGSLLIVRNFPGREGVYACMGLAVSVSAAEVLSVMDYVWIYEERFICFWVIAVLALIYMDLRESKQVVQMIGGNVWN